MAPLVGVNSPFFALFIVGVGVLSARLILNYSPYFRKLAQIRPGTHGYYPALDGLRGLLAQIVFAYHAVLIYFLTVGPRMHSTEFFVRVGAWPILGFFALSAFLFWGQALDVPMRKKEVFGFWINRVRRLLPAHIVGLTGIVVLILFTTHFRDFPTLPTLAVELGRWLTFGLPFGPRGDLLGLGENRVGRLNMGVLWSLRVEALFYLTLPGWLWLSKSVKVRYVLVGLILLGYILSRYLETGQTAYTHESAPWLYLLTDFAKYSALGFLGGVVAAYLVRNKKFQEIFRNTRGKPVRALQAAAIGGTLVLIFWPSNVDVWVQSLMLAPVLMVAILGCDGGLLSRPEFVHLGRVSYGTYLYHPLLLTALVTAVADVAPIDNYPIFLYWILSGMILLAVLLLATVSYRFIEYPFLRSRVKSRKPVLR